MNAIFILLFACSTYSNITLSNGSGVTQGWRLADEFPTCVSEIMVLKSEAEVLDYMNSSIGKKTEHSIFHPKRPSPDKIYRYDKAGLKEIRLVEIYDVKQKVVEEQTLKGYRIGE